MKQNNNLIKEFNKYIKDIAKNYNYNINDNELDDVNDYFFGEDGIINHMVNSIIQDYSMKKEHLLEENKEESKQYE